MPDVNATGLILASLIPLFVGFFWYMPALFGKFLEQDKEPETGNGHHPFVYLGTLICSVLIALVIGAILSMHPPEEVTLVHGAFHGAEAAFFIGIPTFLVIALFEGKPFRYIMVHAGYWLVSMTLMGAILGMFG